MKKKRETDKNEKNENQEKLQQKNSKTEIFW